jgi:hypothetical protein
LAVPPKGCVFFARNHFKYAIAILLCCVVVVDLSCLARMRCLCSPHNRSSPPLPDPLSTLTVQESHIVSNIRAGMLHRAFSVFLFNRYSNYMLMIDFTHF